MIINLKVKTLDARTHEFSIDNEITIRQFKDQIAEKTSIAAENQRIIYQGRVLADEKQVKEYDVDGKVLHVAERPPFSQRGANSRNNDEPMRTFRNRPQAGMRTSPYFRALDGMLVGTMAIPVNNGPVATTRNPPNRYPNSSSFCINRITVAMHMIDCAANIAAYLENPAVGLNNQSLDILQRGRWSMESTVVEVGVSSTDLPRNNNIIDMVQDAVTAALSRTGARNYTVVQLPTVYTNESGETTQQRAGEAANDAAPSGSANEAGGETTAATVIIEDVIETDDEAADGSSDRSTTPTVEVDVDVAVGGQPAAGATAATFTPAVAAAASSTTGNGGEAGAAPAAGEGTVNAGPRRRTRPQVLAQVIQHFRNTQTRLSPFVDRYYDILQNDPTFEESDTTGRENAQRIFDRVSEAFHYLSHAQHAISDLMLDLSQPGPRVLTCRPILVEQSGYIRSNNIFAPNFLAPPPGLLNEVAFRAGAAANAATTNRAAAPNAAATSNATTTPQANNLQTATEASRSAVAMAEIASRAAGAAAEMAAGAASAAAAAAAAGLAGMATDRVEDPVDEPMVVPNAANQGQQPRPNEMDPQLEMARLIQAVVNRATNNETNDVHVEFNSPNIMSINLPVHVMTAAVRPPSAAAAAATPTSAAPEEASADNSSPAGNGEAGAASTSSGTRSGEQRANTLPTTSTQTRSTSRPQIQIGGNNNWGSRIAPTHTAFDRFLPCNSHHIREPEPQNNNNASGSSNNNRSTAAAPAVGTAVVLPTSTVGARPGDLGSGVFAIADAAASATASAPAPAPATIPAAAPSQAAPSTPIISAPAPAQPAADSSDLRAQLCSFLNDRLFAGVPINEQTIPAALDRALEWFGDSLIYLAQYERPKYIARDSVCNVLRYSFRRIIELCSEAPGTSSDAQFKDRLKNTLLTFRMTLFSVLIFCLGYANAELYWRQLMRLLSTPLRSNFRDEALQFLCIYIDPRNPDDLNPELINSMSAMQFLVLRTPEGPPASAETEPFVAPPPLFNLQQQQQPQHQALDTDVEMTEVPATSSSSTPGVAADPLPAVIVGSEPWHMSFPNEWLPVITRDLQTQTENDRPQQPYSDAYISGMSAKRRKIIQSDKPTATVECLIASGVQRAIQSAGLGANGSSSSSINTDSVIGTIAHDAAIQASYTDAVRNSVRERIKQDVDYKPSKYPQITKFAEQK
ncbi:large proline-rich protein BAG6 isoform X7 [Drosophila bipectinata]|uniref:large proline-rich protein BAG6 isoform X7 n=1 Tax=Drosophila bipectinata TaxID=42026 RepID=UPI0038B2A4FE